MSGPVMMVMFEVACVGMILLVVGVLKYLDGDTSSVAYLAVGGIITFIGLLGSFPLIKELVMVVVESVKENKRRG